MKTTFTIGVLVAVFAGHCYAEPTELVDVGDHRLALARMGHGSPTVILESGSGGDIKAWSVILPRIGEFTSALAYARAGRGDSERAKTPRTLTNVVEDLRTLLLRAGYQPPYVLVGRSLGGIYIRAFATMYPREVAGLVLVDGSHEGQDIEFARILRIPPAKFFEESLESEKEDVTRREMEGLAPVMTTGSLGLPGKLPDLPMVVITHTKPDSPPAILKAWRAMDEELFQSTSHGMHIVTNKSDHNITGEEPELVINAVRWVVDTARKSDAENR